MTFAVAALTSTEALVASDTQQVMFVGDGTVGVEHVVKTTSGPHGVAVAAGITSSPTGTIRAHLAKALAAPATMHEAGLGIVDGVAEVLGPYHDVLVQRYGEGEVVWEAAVVGAWTDTGPAGMVLTGHVLDSVLELDVTTFQARADRAQVVALGARHPLLAPLDLRHDGSFGDLAAAAALMRRPLPPTPVEVSPLDIHAELPGRVQQALETEPAADRPRWWPAEIPVAGGNVTVSTARLA